MYPLFQTHPFDRFITNQRNERSQLVCSAELVQALHQKRSQAEVKGSNPLQA